MDHLQKYVSQFRERLIGLLLVNNLIIIADFWLADEVFKLAGWWLAAMLIAVPLLSLTFLPWLSTRYLTEPTKLLWQAILHIAPDAANVPAPDLERRSFGRELVNNLVTHVYQLANVTESIEQYNKKGNGDETSDFLASSLPLPLVVLDPSGTIVFANEALSRYIGRQHADVLGQNVYSVLDLSFTSEHTLDTWLSAVRASKVTATQTWERVRLHTADANKSLLFDLAAYYNKGNPNNLETILVLFDHTKQYSQDDQAMSFVALAVHELRTPLTLLRGYIEAFEEELGPKLDGEQRDFMFKMNASAQQLAAFVNNILNVARVEQDQLVLQLHEEKWPDILQSIVRDLGLRAQVRGITLELEVPNDLPPVGVDRLSIYEVVANLIDNAIKYSGTSKRIIIKSYQTGDNLIETTVQDFGVGIPESDVPNLFEKFYRDHSNRAQVGGTGLGLYLSKAIVAAHGGHIWVRSKPNEGSTFGFTILPYAQLAEAQKTSDNADIVRVTHGWIKNHSLYRR